MVGNGLNVHHGVLTMATIELSISDENLKRLKNLVKNAELENESEVISNALRLYEATVNETRSGSTVVVLRPDGSKIPIFGS